MDEQLLLDHIRWAEDFRKMPYRDSVGKLTIGYGRNLEDNGVRRSEAEFMLKNDVNESLREARTLSFWPKLDPVRQIVIADMVYNMGLPTVLRFKNMIAALEQGDYNLAAHEMKDSKWYRQTGRRAKKLREAMLSGIWKE